jgi:hypothetical protein
VAVGLAILRGGLVLLYVGIGASALSMTLAVGYLLTGPGSRRPAEERPSSGRGEPSDDPGFSRR